MLDVSFYAQCIRFLFGEKVFLIYLSSIKFLVAQQKLFKENEELSHLQKISAFLSFEH